jgi:DNA-directed RNA polymerase specialized sigma subunit
VNDVCDAKAYLRKIELLDAHINNRISDKQALESLATKITATISPVSVSGSGNQDKIGDAVAKIIDLQEEINRKIDKFVNLKRDISELIEQIEDPDQVKILHMRYFEYKPWEQIAIEMKYSYRNVCYIHGKALQAVQAVMEGGKNNADNAEL